MVISHLTDIEGNLRYMTEWASRSSCLTFRKGALNFIDPTRDQWFVNGGDFCDRGPGDLRIGQALVHFKERYPEKVILIAGNREIKCRRFSYELSGDIRERLLKGQAAFWNKKVPPKRAVIQWMKEERQMDFSDEAIRFFLSKKRFASCQTCYLKWMLSETMGGGSVHNKPSTFEYRRLELAQLLQKPTTAITDEEITQSFIDSVMTEEGVIRNYLKHAQLAVILGETLFLHGAITLNNMGYLPGLTYRLLNAKEWFEALNEWFRVQIADWLNHPLEEGLYPPGHKPLDKYIIANPKSIVVSNWHPEGKLTPIPKEIIRFLNAAGIYRVVSGHQPFSDFPLIIRDPDLEVIISDTSYSDTACVDDNRGLAIHNLEIHQKNKESFAKIDAIRKNGTNYGLQLPTRQAVQQKQDIAIGHFSPQGGVIRINENGQFVSSQINHFEVLDELIENGIEFPRL